MLMRAERRIVSVVSDCPGHILSSHGHTLCCDIISGPYALSAKMVRYERSNTKLCVMLG